MPVSMEMTKDESLSTNKMEIFVNGDGRVFLSPVCDRKTSHLSPLNVKTVNGKRVVSGGNVVYLSTGMHGIQIGQSPIADPDTKKNDGLFFIGSILTRTTEKTMGLYGVKPKESTQPKVVESTMIQTMG